jgi:hypothetical protein
MELKKRRFGHDQPVFASHFAATSRIVRIKGPSTAKLRAAGGKKSH